ncbi:MAG: cupin domain-containing protein [Pyrinomonadaceae bacterium]
MNDKAPKDLAEILAPCGSAEFLRSTFGRTLLVVPGQPGKFSALLPWDSLNLILRQHRLDSPRLRLFLEGKQVPVSAYLRHAPSKRAGQGPIPRLQARELTDKLREGATLILDAADELYEPLTRLAESLERTFGEHIQVNAYAGWQSSPGFDLHWDDHDVLILQLYGQKKWEVRGPTRLYPLGRDAERNTERPERAVWEGILSDGHLLYIPRGWWHGALPLIEPTLHLTVGIHNRTGVDLLGWLQDEMRSSELFRQDLPRFNSAEQRKEHGARMRSELISRFDDRLIEEYFESRDARVQPRAVLGLPFTPTSDLLPPSDDFRVRMASPRSLKFVDEADTAFSFTAASRVWRFAAPARPLFELLNSGESLAFNDLADRVGQQLDRSTLRGLLQELIKEGLAVLLPINT